MITFSLIIVAIILVTISTILFCVFLFKGFFSLFPDSTYYSTQLKLKESSSSAHNTKSKADKKKCQLSVLYHVNGEPEAIKAQIQCLATLIEENIGENASFEIICIVDINDQYTIRYLSSLIQEIPSIVPILRNVEGIRWMVNGIIASSGEIIVDAQFLAQEIPILLKSDQKTNNTDFIDFIEPIAEGPTKLFNTQNFSVPVAMTRNAANNVFMNLHMLDFACTNELFYLCQQMNIETRVGRQLFGPKEFSIFQVLTIHLLSKLIMFLYSHRFWKIVNQ